MTQSLTLPKAGMMFAALGAVCVLGLTPDAGGDPPPYIHITGVVRDFMKSHPDFHSPPAGGHGHYAGNAGLLLGPERRPVFNGPGFRVDDQWRDVASRPIAPHLFDGWGAGAVLVGGSPSVSGVATVDTWDSTLGPYGGGNVGPGPNVVPNATMPTLTPPGGMGPSVGNVLYKDPGTSVLSGDLHCDDLGVRDDHRLQIDGNLTILCDGTFIMRDGAVIELLGSSTLEVWVYGDVDIQDSTINDGFYEPSRFALYHLGTGTVNLRDDADMYGTIVSPNGTVRVADNGANFYGALNAANLVVEDTAGLHIDARAVYDQCGNPFADTPGTAGHSTNGGITSAATFGEWFLDVPGVNISARQVITLTLGAGGVYEFSTTNFFPLDDRLFGNEGEAHNYYFTYMIDGRFVYDACAGQLFEFEGNDDVWVFVDGKLAMDLGGIFAGTEQFIDFDRLGLVHGETYPLLFLYAHRYGNLANFRLRTNIGLSTQEVPIVVSAMFD